MANKEKEFGTEGKDRREHVEKEKKGTVKGNKKRKASERREPDEKLTRDIR